ncbi:MAG: ribosome maturation factor RimM [bacterium]|nr:ribosome maturation factor RimM [bacterium]
MLEEFVYVGKIVNTHGIKGEVRILSDFEYKDKVFKPKMVIYIGRKKEQEVINTYRHHKNFEMITMEGYGNINEILKYKGLYVYVKKEDLNLSSEEILDDELMNLKVLVAGKERGYIKDIRKNSGSQKILEIDDNGKTILIPYHPEFINEVNVKEKYIVILPIKGLFE